MHAHTYLYMHTCTYILVHAYLYIHTCTYMYLHVHTCTHMYIHTYIQTDRHTDIQTHRHTDTQTDTHTHTALALYVYIYMYKYVYEIIIGTWTNHSACNEDIMGIHMAYLIGYITKQKGTNQWTMSWCNLKFTCGDITCESWEISARTHGGTMMGIWYLNKQTRWGFPWWYMIGIWWVHDTWTYPLVI